MIWSHQEQYILGFRRQQRNSLLYLLLPVLYSCLWCVFWNISLIFFLFLWLICFWFLKRQQIFIMPECLILIMEYSSYCLISIRKFLGLLFSDLPLVFYHLCVYGGAYVLVCVWVLIMFCFPILQLLLDLLHLVCPNQLYDLFLSQGLPTKCKTEN